MLSIRCWNVVLPIWPFVLSGCFILRCDIDGFVDSFIYYCWLSWLYVSFTLSTMLYLTTTSSLSCPLFAGAKGLWSPPQSVFSSFPISLYRQQGPRRFCYKQSVRVGHTAWRMEPHWHSAKACSMRCTKLQVNNMLHGYTLYEVNWESLVHNHQFSWICFIWPS